MPLDSNEFMALARNQQAFPPEKYEPYQGSWVAFNREGTGIILSSAVSEEALYKALSREGLDLSDHLITYVPGPGDVIDGGVIVSRGQDSVSVAAPVDGKTPAPLPTE